MLNNQAAIDALNKLNGRRRSPSISSFDLSTFYTKIRHDKLLNVLNQSTDFCFKVRDGESISIDGYGAKCTNERRSGLLAFTKSTLKRAVKFLL